MSDTEKRSIERHLLDEFIHLNGGEHPIPGRTVDVSRNGMKVQVNSALAFEAINHVSVNLPGSGGEGIPCRVRRSEKGIDHWEIGLEFDGENDARMLLVERWLESLEKRLGVTDSAPTESRQVPRTRCTLRDIRCIDGTLDVISIEDISLDGMLIRARGSALRGDHRSFRMKLSGTNHDISFTGRIAYVSDETDEEGVQSLGIAVEKMREIDRNRLRNFIIEIASGAAMLEYQRLLERDMPPEEFRIEGTEALGLLRTLVETGLTVNLLDEEGLRILETRCETLSDRSFHAPSPATEGRNSGSAAFFSFIHEGSSYSFSTERLSRRGGLLSIGFRRISTGGRNGPGSAAAPEES